MNKLKLGSCYLLSYLFAVVQVTGSAVSFHQRCFKSQILKKTKKKQNIPTTDQTSYTCYYDLYTEIC